MDNDVMKISMERKQAVHKKVWDIFHERWGNDVAHDKACVYLTKIGLDVLQGEFGLRAIPQAGTMNWQIVPPHLDDGKMATHFSFQFDIHDPMTIGCILNGELPEMHVWIALPDTNEVVDFAAGTFQQHCERIHNIKWLSEPPPPFVWENVRGLSEKGHFYTPDLHAIRYILPILAIIPR